jgi:hypothetical protein
MISNFINPVNDSHITISSTQTTEEKIRTGPITEYMHFLRIRIAYSKKIGFWKIML